MRSLLNLDKGSSEDDGDDSDLDRMISGARKKQKTDTYGRDMKITFKGGFENLGEKLMEEKEQK